MNTAHSIVVQVKSIHGFKVSERLKKAGVGISTCRGKTEQLKG